MSHMFDTPRHYLGDEFSIGTSTDNFLTHLKTYKIIQPQSLLFAIMCSTYNNERASAASLRKYDLPQ